jgi:hypothetical protein
MSTTPELSDLVYAEALRRVPLKGGIGLVERDGPAVFVSGGQPHGLLGRFSPATCVQLSCTDDAVHATILGGRSGIAVDKALFSRQVAGQPLPTVAEEVVDAVSTYLAASTG